MEALVVGAAANAWFSLAEMLAAQASPRHAVATWIFWATYALCARYLFLNLCTLVFLYKYERASPDQPWVATAQVDEVRAAWQQFDRFGVGRLRTRYLARLLRLIAPPLGTAKGKDKDLSLRLEARERIGRAKIIQTSRSRGERIGRLKFSDIDRNPAEIWGCKDKD